MYVSGMALSEFRQCAVTVSAAFYGCNLIMAPDANGLEARRNGTQRCRARLAVADSHGPGSRTSSSGRHGPWACWHAYRDVLTEAFAVFPDAVVTAGHAWRVTYRGLDGFNERYPQTGRRNVGSQLAPVTMPELCACGEAQRWEERADEILDAWEDQQWEEPARAARTAREAEIEELLSDPVFGPPVTAGTNFWS